MNAAEAINITRDCLVVFIMSGVATVGANANGISGCWAQRELQQLINLEFCCRVQLRYLRWSMPSDAAIRIQFHSSSFKFVMRNPITLTTNRIDNFFFCRLIHTKKKIDEMPADPVLHMDNDLHELRPIQLNFIVDVSIVCVYERPNLYRREEENFACFRWRHWKILNESMGCSNANWE